MLGNEVDTSCGAGKETCEFWETLCFVLRVMGSLWRLHAEHSLGVAQKDATSILTRSFWLSERSN